ncbi:glycosyltransferase family 4 protein [Pollutimonas harenae]|uniref:Glycosyltransferase family 4 protein n=1 Tax=Pollutimonas harenae TaxID=657015 RepID=A0A853H2F9_9BURK|nr:glycosyltransferase family 4 protein [Pollutimonas harenae]NYT84344.1 glycosyltransferase family 4 protein [Pollutimonas harenae]TEA73255.1 glycosyltransferase family 1 protein [Pollutimonas harenae]
MQTIVIIAHHAVSLLNFRGLLIRDLVKAGNRVYCLAPDYDAVTRRALQARGATPVDYGLQRTGMNPLRDVRDVARLTRTLRRLRPDVVFSFSTKPMVYGTVAAWLARVPRRVAMVEGAGYVFTTTTSRQTWRRRALRGMVEKLYRFALQRAHRVIFLNPDDLGEFVGLGLVPAGRAALLGGIGVDLDAWRLAPPVVAPIRFLLVARLLREKGIFEYVAAARQILQQYPQSEFVLLGGLDTNPGGLSRLEVQAWVDEGVLQWPGHVPVRSWIEQASVFVLPSYREGVPLSTQEAMAMGRPVITTDVPGCRQTVEEGVNGYIVPVCDVDALASAMCRFIDAPEQISVMGQASREIAERDFDVRSINKTLMGYLLK